MSNSIKNDTKKLPKNNKSGVIGVCKKEGYWYSYATENGKRISLYHGKSKKIAIEKRVLWEKKRSFARYHHGKINVYRIIENKLQKNNKSGHTGVRINKNGFWIASGIFSGKAYHLYCGKSKSDAIIAREIFEQKFYFGKNISLYKMCDVKK
jgi:hypothetical protein